MSKKYNATAGFYRRELTSAGQLGKWDGFFGRSEDAAPLRASFSDKGKRESRSESRDAPSKL